MKRYVFIIIVAVYALSVNGQKQEVIASAGGYNFNATSGISLIEKQINMQELPAGVYFLRLVKGKLINVYKVVKL